MYHYHKAIHTSFHSLLFHIAVPLRRPIQLFVGGRLGRWRIQPLLDCSGQKIVCDFGIAASKLGR